MSQVFVSYAPKDRATVELIKNALQAAGLSVDSAEMTSRPEIQSAECVLIVWSKAAAESESLQEEVRFAIRAWSYGRLLLAVVDDALLPVGLSDMAPIRIGGETGSRLSQLVERAKAIVAASETRETRAKGQPAPPRAETLAGATRSESLSRAAPAPPEAPRIGRFGSFTLAGLAICVALVVGLALYYVRFAGPPGGFEPHQGQATLPPLSPAEPAPPANSAPEQKSRSLQPESSLPRPQSSRSRLPREPAEPASIGSLAREWLPIVVGVLLAGMAIGAAAAWALTAQTARRKQPLQIVTVAQSLTDAGGWQVFVSYSHLDSKTVDGLVQQIERMGYAVWIDRETTGTHRYAEAIVHAIRASKLVALMCSRNAFASDQVIREIYVAGDFKKPFIVFQLDPTDFPDEVLYFISGFPRIPITSVDPQQLRTEIAKLIAA